MVYEMSHNGRGIGIFRIFCSPVKCWFNWKVGGAEKLGNVCNSVAFGDKEILNMRQNTGAAEGAYENRKGKGKLDNFIKICIHRENQLWVGDEGIRDIINTK